MLVMCPCCLSVKQYFGGCHQLQVERAQATLIAPAVESERATNVLILPPQRGCVLPDLLARRLFFFLLFLLSCCLTLFWSSPFFQLFRLEGPLQSVEELAMASQHGVILKIIVNKCYPFVDLKRICQLSVLSPPNWNRSFHVSFVEFAQQKVFNLPLIQQPSQHQIGFCFLSFSVHLHLCRSSRYLNIHIIPAAGDAKTLSLILLQLL